MQQRKNHQNWKIFQDSISVVCYDDSDAQLFPSLSNSCKSKFLPFGAAVLKLGELGVSTQCILLTLCGSSTALLPGPLTSTEVTQKSGWVCLDRGTHGSSWHFHISGFKSILNVKSAQFSVTKEIIDTSHSDRLKVIVTEQDVFLNLGQVWATPKFFHLFVSAVFEQFWNWLWPFTLLCEAQHWCLQYHSSFYHRFTQFSAQYVSHCGQVYT